MNEIYQKGQPFSNEGCRPLQERKWKSTFGVVSQKLKKKKDGRVLVRGRWTLMLQKCLQIGHEEKWPLETVVG